jgi:hypothetical protein
MSKDADENKERVKELQKEKDELILKLVNFNSQTSSFIINNGTPNSGNNLAVKTVDEEEKKKLSEQENPAEQTAAKRLNREKFESLLLKNYFGTSKKNYISRDVKIVEELQDIDCISNRSILFDAYIKENNSETFIVIRKNSVSSLLFYDKLYVQLNKVLLYRNARNTNARLLLLLSNGTDSAENHNSQLEVYFKPAIQNKLLEIAYIDYTEAEYESCLENKK